MEQAVATAVKVSLRPTRDGFSVLLGASNPGYQEIIDTHGWGEFDRRIVTPATDAGARIVSFRMPGSHLYFDGASVGADVGGWRQMVNRMLSLGIEVNVYIRPPNFLSPELKGKLSWHVLGEVMAPFEGCSIGLDAYSICDLHEAVNAIEARGHKIYTEAGWYKNRLDHLKYPAMIAEDYYQKKDPTLVLDDPKRPELFRIFNTYDKTTNQDWANDCKAKGHSRLWLIYPGAKQVS